MIEFIIKYWLQFLFGLIAAGLGIVCKRFYSLYKAEKERNKSDEKQEISKEITNAINRNYELSKQDDTQLQSQINNVHAELMILKRGILSIQGKDFKKDCKRLLDESHHITFEEFEILQNEHSDYNALGGNHDGDALYGLVVKKYEGQLSN